MADDAGWPGERLYRAGDRAISEDSLDDSCAGQYWLSCGLWIVAWLLRLYLLIGACAHAKSCDVCLRQPDRRGLSGLDHSARAGRCVHAVRDGDYYRVGSAGEYVKVEARSSRYTSERRDLSEDRECG